MVAHHAEVPGPNQWDNVMAPRRGDLKNPIRQFPVSHHDCGMRELETPTLAAHSGWGISRRVNGGFHTVAMNLINTIFNAKRLIEKRFSNVLVQSDIKHWPFKVISGPGDKSMIVVNYKGEECWEANQSHIGKLEEECPLFKVSPNSTTYPDLPHQKGYFLGSVLSRTLWDVEI
ncbi:hypothetical protein FXO37_00563 [Capsicum annuum]|nr:hypothetical protein FXO37_00563 [Capsicum annuum]